jgi:putative Holliday junction resolvase
VLGIDPGKVRLGLAISDADRRIASPLATYTRRDPAQDGRYLRKIVDEEEIGLIVIGLPVHMSGAEGTQAQLARAFGAWLQPLVGVPIVFHDERYTSAQAESALWDAGLTHRQRKDRRDRVAAQILLQSFLAAGCPMESPPPPLDPDAPEGG